MLVDINPNSYQPNPNDSEKITKKKADRFSF